MLLFQSSGAYDGEEQIRFAVLAFYNGLAPPIGAYNALVEFTSPNVLVLLCFSEHSLRTIFRLSSLWAGGVLPAQPADHFDQLSVRWRLGQSQARDLSGKIKSREEPGKARGAICI